MSSPFGHSFVLADEQKLILHQLGTKLQTQNCLLNYRCYSQVYLMASGFSDVLANRGRIPSTTLSSLTRSDTMGTGFRSCYFSLFANSGHVVAFVPGVPGCCRSKLEPGIKTLRGFGRRDKELRASGS